MATSLTSRLLTLPRELQDMIYTEAFGGAQHNVASRFCIDDRMPHSSGLLMACSQTYFEAIEIYYRKTTFVFSDYCYYLPNAIKWMHNISRTRLSQIENIEVEVSLRASFEHIWRRMIERQARKSKHSRGGRFVEWSIVNEELTEFVVGELHKNGIEFRRGVVRVGGMTLDAW